MNPSVSTIVFCFAFSFFLLLLLIFIILQNYSYLFCIYTTSLYSENTAVSFSKYAPSYSLKYSSRILQFTLTYPFKILLFSFSKYTPSYPLKILIFIHKIYAFLSPENTPFLFSNLHLICSKYSYSPNVHHPFLWKYSFFFPKIHLP